MFYTAELVMRTRHPHHVPIFYKQSFDALIPDNAGYNATEPFLSILLDHSSLIAATALLACANSCSRCFIC
jgi:hypothetical protein